MLVRLIDCLLIFYSLFYLSLFIFPFFKISNISGPTMVFLVLLSARYSVNKKTFFMNPVFAILKKFLQMNDKMLLIISILVIFIILLGLSITRHFSFSSGASDLGIFDQAIWNTAQGDILFSSLKGNINLLGDHFEPILLFIAPLYKIWSNVSVLFILQAFLLASAVIPLYLIAKARLNSRLLIFVFIISYMLSKPMRGVGLSDFHPECFILVFLFWAYYFLLKKNNFWLFISVFILLLCKEDVSFLISTLGIFTLFFQKRIKLGVALFVGGITAWFLETKVIIPFFNPLGKYVYMNRLPFGLSYADNLKAIFENPSLLPRLLFQKEKLLYCLKLFGSVGFLPLLSPVYYILIATPLLKNLLGVQGNFNDITAHYTAGIIPFLYISSIYGVGWITDRVRSRKSILFISSLITLSSLFFYGKTDGHKLSRFIGSIKSNNSFQKITYLRLVPQNASVSTNFNLVPHLSHRKYIFQWNPRFQITYVAEYLVIDMSLLEYLSKKDISQIGLFFEDIKKKEYKELFCSPDNKFFIFHNPNIDKTLTEKAALVLRENI